jgi:hypothetical protein
MSVYKRGAKGVFNYERHCLRYAGFNSGKTMTAGRVIRVTLYEILSVQLTAGLEA